MLEQYEEILSTLGMGYDSDFMVWGSAFIRSLLGESFAEQPLHGGEPNYPWPWVLFFQLALLQLLANLFVRNAIVQPIMRVVMNSVAVRPRQVTHSRIIKFTQAHLEMIFYSAYFAIGYIVVSKQSWVWPSAKWWDFDPDNRRMALDMRFFYVAYGARYFQNFIMVFLEPKRKDFWEMQIHHSVTVILIIMSYTTGMYRVGGIIMVLLDIADPPLHMAKQAVYMKEISPKTTKIWAWSSDSFFVVFAILFTVTRMGMYPYVVWSCTIELYNIKYPPVPFDVNRYIEAIGWVTIGCQILVWVLMILQIFWKRLLAMAVYKVLLGKELADNRSDSEHTDSEAEESRKKK